jgi:hypothetical protein
VSRERFQLVSGHIGRLNAPEAILAHAKPIGLTLGAPARKVWRESGSGEGLDSTFNALMPLTLINRSACDEKSCPPLDI